MKKALGFCLGAMLIGAVLFGAISFPLFLDLTQCHSRLTADHENDGRVCTKLLAMPRYSARDDMRVFLLVSRANHLYHGRRDIGAALADMDEAKLIFEEYRVTLPAKQRPRKTSAEGRILALNRWAYLTLIGSNEPAHQEVREAIRLYRAKSEDFLPSLEVLENCSQRLGAVQGAAPGAGGTDRPSSAPPEPSGGECRLEIPKILNFAFIPRFL